MDARNRGDVNSYHEAQSTLWAGDNFIILRDRDPFREQLSKSQQETKEDEPECNVLRNERN